MTPPCDAVVALNDHYVEVEARYQVVEREHDYAPLVVPTGNGGEPFHRWFHFKEGYSHTLLTRLLKDAEDGEEALTILDPFSGSGTTLVSALGLAREGRSVPYALGIERNPVMHLISSAKLLGASQGSGLAKRVGESLPSFWATYKSLLSQPASDFATASVTLNNENYFDDDAVTALVALGRASRAIDDHDCNVILQACLATSVEATGRIRRDGRALRRHPKKTVVEPSLAFQASLDRLLSDMSNVTTPHEGNVSIYLGDARELDTGEQRFRWAIFSPPYPNNIDYTEVYKTEAWALEMFHDPADMRAQRLLTLRSHPSITFPDAYVFEDSHDVEAVFKLLQPLLDAIPDDRYKRGRDQLVRGYGDDMRTVLLRVRAAMESDGRCAVVVGNSSHGHSPDRFVVASDLIIARLAELSGWTVDEIRVARRPKRRADDHGWLRESVVMLSC